MSSALVLVLNCGSSSIKFAVIDPQSGHTALSGLAERLGTTQASFRCSVPDAAISLQAQDHGAAIQAIVELIQQQDLQQAIIAIGHRIVHGGEYFQSSCRINADTLAQIRRCSPLAPLHNPAQVQGIDMALAAFPNLPQVAVFDTSFHQTMPQTAYLYPLPYALYQQHGIRRYGFHGTSHRYVSREAAQRLGKEVSQTGFISAHLGNGCSLCAIDGGLSRDTSMGFTPLEGLMMGTRCGDIDASIPGYLCELLQQSPQQINQLLNQQSGLLGVSGLSNDMRSLLTAEAEGHPGAKLAIDLFCYRLAKYMASLMASLSRFDALLFTGGIGENSSPVRERTIAQLKLLGFALDLELNNEHGRSQGGRISSPGSRPVWVIPTNEELLIAQDTLALMD